MAFPQTGAPAAAPRIPELDGLRALLAWWVVVFHARGPTFSAAFEAEGGPLAILSLGPMAVEVFIVLSGFVIALLLDRGDESPGAFLLRRFLRLFPVYAVCFVAMLLLHDVYVANLSAQADVLGPEMAARVLRDAEEPMRELPAQLAVHALMLHGLVPDAWLHNAAGAFLMPAWSVSLEWQFYLVAPLVVGIAVRSRMGAGLVFAVAAVAWATRGVWPAFSQPAFLPLALHLFAIGIASYLALRRVSRDSTPPRWLASLPLAVAAGIAALVCVQVARLGVVRGTTPGAWFPLAVWALVFASVLARGADGGRGLGGALRRLLSRRALRWLGAISYATYLAHWPVLVASQALARHVLDAPSPAALLAWHAGISFPLVVLVSHALHHGVERPGIELGRRLAHERARRT